MVWVEIPNGSSSYFYNEETKQSTFVCPRELLLEKIAGASSGSEAPSARSQTLSTASRGSPLSKSPVAENVSKAENRVAMDAWTVQIHPDSGMTFYSNLESKELCWSDPFHANEDADLEAAIEQGEQRENNYQEHEKLAGFQLSPPHNNLKHDEAVQAGDKFMSYLEKGAIEVTEEDGIKLKFPEYVDLQRQIDDKQTVSISILLPEAVGTTLPRLTLPVLLKSSVDDLLNATFKKFKTQMGKDLDKAGTGRYIFKVCGYMDYMIHGDFKMGYYDHILFCMRKRIKIELELVKLTPADQMDLGPVLGRTYEEELRSEETKMEAHEDEWKADRDIRKREIRKMKNVVMQDDIKWPFRCLVRGIVDCPGEELNVKSLRLEIGLYYGGGLIGPTSSGKGAAPNTQPVEALQTAYVPFSSEPSWPGVWLSSTQHEVALLPPATRVGFMLYGTADHKEIPLAGVAVTLVDFQNMVLTGEKALKLWPHKALQIARDPDLANPKCERLPHLVNLAAGVVGENEDVDAGILHVVFDSYATPVYANFPVLDEKEQKPAGGGMIQIKQTPEQEDKDAIAKLARTDPLYAITYKDKHLLWTFREYCSAWPELLPKFLLSVSWGNSEAVSEARKMIKKWRKYPPGREVEYLEMLDINFSDPVVREFICRQLNCMNDYSFDQYMLQMVQCLKYEPYHDSPLARMILRRALQAPYKIGHNFYWLLRSEMHNGDICARYGAILRAYVSRCGPHRAHLRRQISVNDMVQVIAEEIKTLPKSMRSKSAAEKLKKVAPNFPNKFQLCLSPRIECRGLKSEKCKVMSSKKMPLWLVFENADENGEDYLAIFKAGDDLRQDLMTLQLLKIMDTFWTQNGLDLRLNPYMCCATGHDLGMIEVVKNSDTTARIQVEYGGRNMGAWRDTPIDMFLREKNKDSKYFEAVTNFVHTCAGYCVATYVLGIGDRHADNIMITNAGHLFHIDFGHFLGNFKSKFGYKRERAPFVFTPEMAYVMGNKDTTFGFPDFVMKGKEPRIGFPEFEQMCCQSYNVLREHSNLLINLFILVTPAAMPELLEKEDVTYLKEMLSCELSKEQADKKFKQEIAKSLRTVSRRFDNWIHNMKHG